MTRYAKLFPAIVSGAVAGFMSWHALYGWALQVPRFADVAWGFPIVVDVLAVYSVGLVLKRNREQRPWAWPLVGLLVGLVVSLVGNYAYVQHWVALVPPVAFFIAFELARQELAHADDVRDAVAGLTVERDGALADVRELREDLAALSEAHDDAAGQVAALRAQLAEARTVAVSTNGNGSHANGHAPAAAAAVGGVVERVREQFDDDLAAVVERWVAEGRSVHDREFGGVAVDALADDDTPGRSARSIQRKVAKVRELASAPLVG